MHLPLKNNYAFILKTMFALVKHAMKFVYIRLCRINKHLYKIYHLELQLI